jgi:hypothetical protein
MSNQSVTLFSSMAVDPHRVFPVISEKAKGSVAADATHTVQYSTINGFIGLVKTQATLELNPIETDWFDVDNTLLGNGLTPVSDQTLLITFNGNFVWVRVVIDSFSAGSINRILYNHN